MTEPTTPTEAPDDIQPDPATASEPTTPEPEADHPDDEPQGDNPNREAAKWRNKFRDAETELTTMQQRLETLQRSEAERIAATALHDPTDMWRDGTQLTDLLDDNGNIDPNKVTDTATKIADTHQHWKRRRPVSATEVTSTTPVGADTTPTFSDAFRPRSE
ncbi:hypothetical protein [Mycobacterium syngnathidarum]|uniref:Scaffolding protein n=1 Tax=Mycobacterium syngnathidarum TaxID=1908205 RepID=A0A1S1JXK9_9MYCO|nr:hypothetical protein [Mycobacterium syngnathidarum]OHT93182.1 hypothetical protein BKG61_22470 [Mycobacterium syngnathidarum]OLT97400.1 hypothetical protein BKG60_07260 [Mycobacterium syngnathidarum]